MRGAAHRVTSPKTGCIKLLHCAEMALHDAGQVETQTIDDAYRLILYEYIFYILFENRLILKEYFLAVSDS